MSNPVTLAAISAFVLILAAAARLMARRAARPAAWKICYPVFMCLGMATLFCAINAPRTIPVHRHGFREECVANLKQIDGAKAAWAEEMHKGPSDVPLDADIFGEDKYIRKKSTCPAGGIYILGSVGQRARCSLGHSYAKD